MIEDDDEGPIFEAPRLTRYDKARAQVREAEEALKAEVAKLADDADLMPAQLAGIMNAKLRLKQAQDRLKREIDRDGTEVGRYHNNVDEWRTYEGREEFNLSRRKVRLMPNAGYEKLDGLTEDEKRQRLTDQKKASQYRAKKRAAGWTEDRIAEGLAAYMAKRLADRQAKTESEGIAEMLAAHEFGGKFA